MSDGTDTGTGGEDECVEPLRDGEHTFLDDGVCVSNPIPTLEFEVKHNGQRVYLSEEDILQLARLAGLDCQRPGEEGADSQSER